MAREVGDLWPQGSGVAALGAELTNGGLTGEVRPFAHVHALSGVYHNGVGSSGIIRFANGVFEQSVDGGQTFTTLGAGSALVDLQDAYDSGNEIDLNSSAATPDVATLQQTTIHTPVFVKQITPGAGNRGGHNLLQSLKDASIVASGFSLTPNLTNTFCYTAIGPSFIGLQGSGTPGSHPASFLIEAGSQGIAAMTASGTFIFSSQGAMLFTITEGGQGNDVQFLAGAIAQPGGQVKFQPFLGSGQLEYRFGPHQSWYIKTSSSSTSGPFGDGFNPLVPSGQILQMILENGGGGGASTLQEAYDNGASIYIDNGNLVFGAVNGKTRFGTNGTRAPLNVSGIFQQFTSNLVTGDMTMLTHAMTTLDDVKTIIPTSQAEASAKSLGPGTIQFNTGSGLINLSTGSGIAQFFNLSSQSLSTTPIGVTFFTVGNNVRDTLFHAPNNSSGITIMSPGLYRCIYSAGVEKTGGSTLQSVITYLVKNDIELLGSRSFAAVANTTNARFNTANAAALFDASAGDVIALAVANATNVGGNTIQTIARATNINIEYIGPPRITQSTLAGV